MKSVLIIAMTALLVTACTDSRRSLHDYVGTDRPLTDEQVIDDLANIDEITECEIIIADSSLKDGDGEKAWKTVGDGMIRIKNGSRYYLRKMTKNGTVTAFTYSYDDNNTPQ